LHLVPAVPAVLASLALFLLPGLAFVALVRREERSHVALDEALFLVVGVSVAASAWLALLLAELGRFSLPTAGVVLAAASALAMLLGRRRVSWPFPRANGAAEWLPAFAVLAVALVLQARPTEYLVGGRDPGVYVSAMALIGRTGGIAYTDPAVRAIPPDDVALFYRNPGAPDFTWARFAGFPLENPRNGRVFPEFFHLFPAFGAYLFQSMGVKGALATPPVFGVLGTLGVFFVLRRLFGAAPALLGALLLATNVVQVWFARYPVSEPMSQFLVFLALLAFLHWDESGDAAWGTLAGTALGLTLLVRIDNLLLLAPVALYLLVRRAHHDLPWRRAAAFLVPLLLLGLHAAVHGALFSRKYLVNVTSRPYWSQPPWVWIGGALAVGAVLVLVHRRSEDAVRLLEAHGATLRRAVAGALVLGFAYAYLLRPILSAWAGADGNDAAEKQAGALFAALRALGFHRLAAHDAQALVRLGWFVTPLALVLALLGLLLVLREFRLRHLLPVSAALASALFYLYKIRVYNDYFFALRRYVPIVLPFVLGLAALALVRMAARGRWYRAAAAVLTVVLFGAFLRDTLPLARYRDWDGAVRFVNDLARRFGPDDLLVFEQPKSIHLLSLPLWAVHGLQVLVLARFQPDPERLQHFAADARARYRNVYFVHTAHSGSDFCGVFLERVEPFSFGTFEWERAYVRKPRGPEFRSFSFTVSRLVPPHEIQVPPLPEVDVGGSDDVQVSGFYDKEGGAGLTYRWTGPCASVYLPGARPGATLVVRAAIGRPTRPAAVAASLNGVPLGTFEAGAAWTEHALRLPDPLPPGPPVLRIDVPAWRPTHTDPAATDERDLGVMVDRLTIRDTIPGLSTGSGGAR
jgi:4-amino-4-deoxy-L-arabinose transferase-like glycosyltransferase